MEEEQIRIKSSDNKEVQFKKEFANFSTYVQEADLNSEIPVNINEETLLLMRKFLEAHDYDAKQIVINKPLTSQKIKDNLDEKSYEILKDYQGIQNVEKIKPIIDGAYYLGFDQLKDACLACLASEFYVGPSEADLEEFKKQHGIKELSAEEELDIMREFEPVFQTLNKKFQDEMQKEQQKFEQEDGTNQ
ncbi:hypothetical protein PPERSA_09376 [Pseudocohnilembus persalinus]|uniref:SKP1 component dimerisation domain-containing protein n=1 Tax=Pseudocohnilembus persalinus TaxID=266149 RepID=A0A0V0QL43_PSEPJ|nr:hypothetical protein PPERSA_09376 [Pseudocohnilembus persalinus]|eukprot:KRX02958.1 hypothetical protein PPERSA_09376 [Pseudocohnilembus persalinus]